MGFNDNAHVDSENVRRNTGSKSGGKIAAIGGGGGILVLILGALSMQYLGVDITKIFDVNSSAYNSQSYSSAAGEDFSCTGAEANTNQDCRFEAAAVTIEQFWEQEAASVGVKNYRNPTTYLYSGSTTSACGTASNAVGPFYCSADESIYIDGDFFEILSAKYGASGGPLAEMYVLAHEWGHHIQHLQGRLAAVDHNDVGPTSQMVRLELQADCFAGAWMGGAAKATDDNGNQIMFAPTEEEIAQTISAAKAVGDDNVAEQAGMNVQPENFSHGTSQQRIKWLMRGYEQGANGCDTFGTAAANL